MRVFVAGATGAIGTPLISQLLSAGHDVCALASSGEKALVLESRGVEAFVADARDGDALSGAIGAARPEVVVNQLTKLSPSARPRYLKAGLAATAELRRQASEAIMRVAEKAGVRRVIAQSISFVYAPGPGARTEDDALHLVSSPRITEVLDPVMALERATLSSETVEGVVLRYGTFYGPGTYYAPGGAFAQLIARRRMPLVGGGRGVFGFLHVDDAAAATLAALDGPPGVYNVVDDRPARVIEWLPLLASMLGAGAPWTVPSFAGRLFGGPYFVYLMDEQPAVSNARARTELGWEPRFADWRDGFDDVFASPGGSNGAA